MKAIKSVFTVLLCAVIVMLTGCASMNTASSGASQLGDNPSIAATSVAICEILDALDYDNVTGVPETQRELPSRYDGKTTIGSPMNPDYEVIKQLSPDLVLSPKTLENSLSEDYTKAGINSAFLNLSSVEGMYDAIASLGELLNRSREADKLIEDYESYIKEYSSSAGESKSVLILMAFPDGFYLVATENSYVGNLVKLAGGKNVYTSTNGDDENGFVTVNPEDMVQKKPDEILVFAHYSEDDAFKYMKNEFKTNENWQFFDAVKKNNIAYLPSEYFGMSATLNWKDSLEYLKPILYGES